MCKKVIQGKESHCDLENLPHIRDEELKLAPAHKTPALSYHLKLTAYNFLS